MIWRANTGGSGVRKPAAELRLSPLLTAATLLAALVCGALSYFEPYTVRALRDIVFDSYQRLSPRSYDPASPVRVVAIDDESIERIGQWPWPRETLARLVERLTEAGVAVTVLDVLFSEPERASGALPSSGDAAFAQAIGRGRVVLGMALGENGPVPESKAGFVQAGDPAIGFVPGFGGALLPLAALREQASGLAAMNFTPDRDLIVREVPAFFSVRGALASGVAVEALRVAQGASTVVIRSSNASRIEAFGQQTGVSEFRVGQLQAATGPKGGLRLHFAGDRPERRIPAWQVLAGEVERGRLEGAVALVGATATALLDLRATPLQPVVPGVDIHAESIESLIAGVLLTRPDYMRGLEAVSILLGCVIAVFAATRFPPLRATAFFGVLLLVFVTGSLAAFLYAGLLIDPLWPALGTIFPFAIATFGIYRQSELSRRQIRDAFSRYVSPAVVEALARDPAALKLGGETRTLTVMFSDVRGFTARSETLSADQVVQFLNEIHTPMTEHVLDSGGTLDKFIGDGMMAFWNAPLDHPDPVRAALACTLRMHDSILAMNERLRAAALAAGAQPVPIALGIGLHLGPASVGNVGSLRRFDYSAIGDTVNTAARIEPLCKAYGVPIIVSDAIVEAASDFAYASLGFVRLRGQQRRTAIFALHGLPASLDGNTRAFLALHDAAVRLAVEGAPEALVAIKRCADHPLGAGYQKAYAALVEAWREALAQASEGAAAAQ